MGVLCTAKVPNFGSAGARPNDIAERRGVLSIPLDWLPKKVDIFFQGLYGPLYVFWDRHISLGG